MSFPPAQQDSTSRIARKWVGRGRWDACGNPWVIELTRNGDRVYGTFWRGPIKYDVSGVLNESGDMEGVLAGKNRFFQHRVGPRLMEFNVTFGSDEATGEHYFANGHCLTRMQLIPAATGSTDTPGSL